MNSWSRNYFSARQTFVNGSLISSAPGQQDRSDVQNVVGFGPGDFVSPTPGSFTHTVQQKMNGRQWVYDLTAPFNKTLVTGPNPSYNYGQGIPPPSPSAQDATNIQNIALTKLYKKVRAYKEVNTDGIDVSVDIGESRETKRMVSQAVRSAGNVVSVAKGIANRVFRQGKVVGELSKAWLAYTYGWKPLLSDIHELAKFTSVYYKEFTFTASHGHKWPHEVYGIETSIPANIAKTRSVGYHSLGILYSVTVSVTDQSAFDLDRLTSLDPKRIAWELLPLSFVLDWFVDIGGYLQLQEAALGRGLTFERGFVTVSNKSHYVASIAGAGKSGGQMYDLDFKAMRTVTSKSRTVLSGFPRPAYPSVQADLGWRRVISAGALLAQALGHPNHPVVDKWKAVQVHRHRKYIY